ncbi:MAG: glycoside hydrolase family 13 protein [Clostridia bacterium]|nr:glycoside hydrolase family 13 protein [Clostridia bacterium]
MIFNSHNKQYKSHFGAVKTDTQICYKLFAPDFDKAFMIIITDEGTERLPMTKEADGWFCITKSFDKCGVYFYRFALINGLGEKELGKGQDGSGMFDSAYSFQQTVYDKDFTVPKDFGKGIIYQIFPDRFYKAESENMPPFPSDRILADWEDEPEFALGFKGRVINNDYFCGNLLGIQQKLPYIKSLGCTTIYLNPIFEAHSNHRYNTADYMNIDPMLGTNEDFKNLCRSAKEQGISIILDGVFSHTGSDSIYFNREGRYDSEGAYQSKSSPYYNWFNFEQWPNKYGAWWGHITLPETNELNEDFNEFINGKDGVISHWMKMGASGFRLDVADELPDEFIENIRTAVKSADKNGILYGEVWEDASNKISYDKRRRFLLGNELDSVMNYPFCNMIIDFVKGGSGVDFINGVMQILENYPKECVDTLMNLLGTHDTERIITLLAGEPVNGRDRNWQSRQKMSEEQLSEGFKLLKLATVLQYTLPGIPCVYYGDELLIQGYRDPFNRKTFDWSKTESESVQWYKKLGEIRTKCPALDGGEFIAAQYEDGYVSFVRAKGEDEIYVMVNPSDEAAYIWLLPGWRDDNVIMGDEPVDGILTLPPKGIAIMGRGSWVSELK